MMVPVLKKNSSHKLDELQDGFIVLIDKPRDWTSFDVCKKIRNSLPYKKVGHAGTLDPFATGLLLIGVGKGTKSLQYLSATDKKYLAEIKFGVSTDSFDRTGKVTNSSEEFGLELHIIEAALKKMSGDILQLPPMFSAKKVKGKALYHYARKGIEIDRQENHVKVYNVKVESWKKPLLKINIHVSKGTYIRSYAHDLGTYLQVPAMLNQLQRTQVSDFDLKDSFLMDQFFEFWNRVAA